MQWRISVLLIYLFLCCKFDMWDLFQTWTGSLWRTKSNIPLDGHFNNWIEHYLCWAADRAFSRFTCFDVNYKEELCSNWERLNPFRPIKLEDGCWRISVLVVYLTFWLRVANCWPHIVTISYDGTWWVMTIGFGDAYHSTRCFVTLLGDNVNWN